MVKLQVHCSCSRMCHFQLLLDMTHCVVGLCCPETTLSASHPVVSSRTTSRTVSRKWDSVIQLSNLLADRWCPTVIALILAHRWCPTVMALILAQVVTLKWPCYLCSQIAWSLLVSIYLSRRSSFAVWWCHGHLLYFMCADDCTPCTLCELWYVSQNAS
jgi:hypothetical protein